MSMRKRIGGLMMISLILCSITLDAGRRHPANATTCDPARLSQLSVDPARPHRVAPATWTSFALTVANPGPETTTASLDVPAPANWTVLLAPADDDFQPVGDPTPTLALDLSPGGASVVLVLAQPSQTIPPGDLLSTEVTAQFDDGGLGCVTLHAAADSRAKLFLIGIDGLSPNYLRLNRHGQPNPAPGTALMPRLREFVASAAWFPQARASMPSITDPNVFAALSGSWPGTSGIPYVGYYYYGWTDEGVPVLGQISRDKIRYGAEGLPVASVFDVAQDPALGGEPGRFTAILAGKNQIDLLFRDGPIAAADLVADGMLRPPYLTVPQPYLLGDPESDPDALTDRDGVNLLPPSEYRQHPAGFGLAGDQPLENPSDAWIGQSALRILAAEDPDVFFIHLGGVDKIHHAAGAADWAGEWLDPGTPGQLWDDISTVNRYANREPVLDVVYEADRVAGTLFDALGARDVLDRSFISLWSDHSEWTYYNTEIDARAILEANGLGEAGRRLASWQEIGYLFLTDPGLAPQVEEVLETYTTTLPVTGQIVHPLMVLNRAEMDSGVDGATGRFGRDGGPGRGELYSEWLIEHPVADNSKVVWPDLFVLARYRFQLKNFRPFYLDRVLGGHAGTYTMSVLLTLRGPSIVPGSYSVQDTSLVDLMPTIYQLQGWTPPASVDGRVLTEILEP